MTIALIVCLVLFLGGGFLAFASKHIDDIFWGGMTCVVSGCTLSFLLLLVAARQHEPEHTRSATVAVPAAAIPTISKADLADRVSGDKVTFQVFVDPVCRPDIRRCADQLRTLAITEQAIAKNPSVQIVKLNYSEFGIPLQSLPRVVISAPEAGMLATMDRFSISAARAPGFIADRIRTVERIRRAITAGDTALRDELIAADLRLIRASGMTLSR